MRAFIARLSRRFKTEIRSARFWRFFLGTVGGLATDLSVFTLLTKVGLAPGFANIISATLGLLVVYFLVTRYAFKAQHSNLKFIAFVTWYSLMILLWGGVIQLLVVNSGISPLVAKLATIPISFGLNFVFSRVLFGNRVWDFIKSTRIKNQSL
jgi:putative flippase GtrA